MSVLYCFAFVFTGVRFFFLFFFLFLFSFSFFYYCIALFKVCVCPLCGLARCIRIFQFGFPLLFFLSILFLSVSCSQNAFHVSRLTLGRWVLNYLLYYIIIVLLLLHPRPVGYWRIGMFAFGETLGAWRGQRSATT